MRVVILQQYFKRPSAISGSSRTYQMAKRIADRGHDVHIVSASAEVTSPTAEKIDNLTAHWVRGSYSHHMDFKQRIRSFLEYAVRSIPEAYRVNGDVVFASSTPLTVAIPGLAVSWLRNRPFVFEVRDLWPAVPIAMGALENKWMRRLAKVLEGLAYRASSHVVALSPDMKDGIVSTE